MYSKSLALFIDQVGSVTVKKPASPATLHASRGITHETLTGTNMKTTSVLARAGLVLLLLTSPALCSTSSPVKVSLRTSCPSPPFLLELMYGLSQTATLRLTPHIVLQRNNLVRRTWLMPSPTGGRLDEL